MSSSYEEGIFERGRWSFALSQRFTHVCPSFRGTFKLVIQSVCANILQRTLPYYLSRFLFFNFIIFSILLFIMLLYEFFTMEERQEDWDLLDIIRDLVRQNGFKTMVFNMILITVLCEVNMLLISFILSNLSVTSSPSRQS